MLNHFRNAATKIKQGRPGSRFIDYYNYRKKRIESAAKYWAMILLGALLTLLGLLLGPVPMISGFLFGIPGIIILCSRSKIAAKSLDATERLLRKIRRFQTAAEPANSKNEKPALQKPTKP